MEEVLSRLLRKRFKEGRISKFYHPVGAPLVSHLLYADDLLVFTNGEKWSMRMLLKTLGSYEQWSRQLLNKEKFAIFFLKKDQFIKEKRVA